MELKDIKHYKGYLPVKMEKEDVIDWLIQLIGIEWGNKLFKNKHHKYRTIRYRFGDINEIQFYMNDKSWYGIPLPLWLKFTCMDTALLDKDCWNWINEQKKQLHINNNYTEYIPQKESGLLDI